MNEPETQLLIIDDDAMIRGSIAAYLQDSGFHMLVAEHGQRGLEMFYQYQPDLILCDLRMPDINGLVVLKQVRESLPETPFIVISGAGVMADVVEALRLGASDFLLKPIIDLEVLEHAVSKALKHARLVQQNRLYRDSLERAIRALQENLVVLREDHKAGRQVQTKMLPQQPFQMDGYFIDYKIWPSLYLSGDFVDYFAINDHSFGFYLADVSGHGASSAFITVLLKHLSLSLLQEFRNQGVERSPRPSSVLSVINKSLLDSCLGKHVTVFAGVIDTRAKRLTYSVGGHFPQPILSMKGRSRYLDVQGLPVGLFPDADYRDVIIDLSGPFTLTILSDGILEVLPRDSLQEKEGYLLSSIDQQARSADAVISSLDVPSPLGTSDDVALLVVSGLFGTCGKGK